MLLGPLPERKMSSKTCRRSGIENVGRRCASSIRRILLRVRRSQRAQALLEFAFIAPIMLVLLAAIVDFGIAVDRRLVLQHAVREGARFGAVHTDMNDIKDLTVDHAQGLVDTADVIVCYPDGGDPGAKVTVSATYSYDLPIFGDFMNSFFGGGAGSIDMTPSGTARLERSVDVAPPCT